MAYNNPFLIPDSLNSFVDRSFVDLSIDGIKISELGLVVVNDGDTLVQDLTPQFTNNTTNVPGRNNILLWTTDITNGVLKRTLATEKMTQRQLNRLKQLLRPGVVHTIILGLKPYCYTYAFLESVPLFKFVPFDDIQIVDNVLYKTHIYRGSCDITWTLIYPYWYGDTSITNVYNYRKQPWIFESGLPLTSKSGVFYASSDYKSTGASGTTASFKICNSGNSLAHPLIKIKFNANKFVVTSTFATNWKDITLACNGINSTVISKPRAFKDVEYFYNLLATTTGMTKDNFLDYKTKILIDLRENLDSNSEWRDQLIFMTQATFNTGSTSGTYKLDTLKTAVQTLFNSTSFDFIVDSQNRQMKMIMYITATNWYDPNANTQVAIESVLNIEGVSNGKYMVVDGNTSIANNFSAPESTIAVKCNIAINDVLIQFLNEYL